MFPEEDVLCIFSWINITCEIIYHLEPLISSVDKNIGAKPKVDPKYYNENVYVIAHMIYR